ncbi:conserved hypothetical protein [Gammaproteobacteria bacterium]
MAGNGKDIKPMSLKPWREIALPHRDVLEETFRQSEFTADITSVQSGKAAREYQEAAAFFDRTFITAGMHWLLTQVAQRLTGQGGEPVIRLQTVFGVGKTHSLLAAYHLVTRQCPLTELIGIPELLEQAGVTALPQARVVVLDGTAHSPGQHWKHGQRIIRTLWGELAWQLGGEDGFNRVLDADATGTSPGKDILRELLEDYAPCIVLIDELIAYVRQFPEGRTLSGGSYDSNLSFVQALTEAANLVPTTIVLASLPQSESETGSQRGMAALRTLEKIFGRGRGRTMWKPVIMEEACGIIRCRLFDPIRDPAAQDTVCRAFAKIYEDEGTKLPTETQENRYFERLTRAYPIHPELLDRLYEDWATIDGFSNTRGVLKLMAKVISRLWKDNNRDLMILPGSLPLYDACSRNDLTCYLPLGWEVVIERDIDGDRAETTDLENHEPRFGLINAAGRVARTIFLGSAPASVTTKDGIRGLDRARVLLGCLQPGQASSTYLDALSRLTDRLHYLNHSSDKTQDAVHFWFEPRANLRREMEERKRHIDDRAVRSKIAEVFEHMFGGATFFDGIHLFVPSEEVPDDSALRLVILSPHDYYSRGDSCPAFTSLLDHLRNRGPLPRYRGNRLLFLAADQEGRMPIGDTVRMVLAWSSLVDDVREGRLNLDPLQKKPAEKELQIAQEVLPRLVRECYRWLLCPGQETFANPSPTIAGFPLNTTTGTIASEIERTCMENELVLTTWSPIHLRAKLQELYWTLKQPAVGAMSFWEDTLRSLYLPRLKNREVLAQTIRSGVTSCDFFGTAYGKKGKEFEGFHLGGGTIQLDNTLLLIEPETARAYANAYRPVLGAASLGQDFSSLGATPPDQNQPTSITPATPKTTSFYATTEVPAALFAQLADKLVAALSSNPRATVRVTLEILNETIDTEGNKPEAHDENNKP